MSRPLQVVVEADGGSRGNPGPAGWGAVVRDAASDEVLLERAEVIGKATNNVAEYGGLIGGLQAAAELGAATVKVRMDSKLVVEQMSGRWQIKHPGLRPLAAQAAALVRRFDSVTWQWVPRERNTQADRLANEAMDRAAKRPGKRATGSAGPAGPASASAGAGTVRAEPSTRGLAAARPGAWEPPTGTSTRLVLVRHGETTLTAERRYSGRGDVPLSPRGRAQADATARRVAAFAPRVAAVVSSPLARCTVTAQALAAALGDPPATTEPDLVECDFGEWEGLTFSEARAQWSDEMDAWLGSTSVAPPGGESFQQVAKRVRRTVTRLRDSYPDATLVVVSHVSPLKILLRDALAAGDTFLHRLFLDPGGVSVVDLYPDGAVAVRTVNDTSHLIIFD